MGIVKDNLYRLSTAAMLPLFTKQTVFPYHHLVRNDKVAHIENLYEYKNITQFKADIDFLLAHYQPIDPAVLLKGERPDNSFLLTFDDGLEEVYSVIFPILKEKKVNAIFFVNPNFVDNAQSLYKHDISVIISHVKSRGFDPGITRETAKIMGFSFASNDDFARKLKETKFLDRDKIKEVLTVLGIDMTAYLANKKPYVSRANIREMLDAGFYFGGHTMSHPPLSQLSFEQQKIEISDSVQWLKNHFGIGYSMFAFPFSDKGISRKLIDSLFADDGDMLIFGNAGIKKDIDPRIIQRFSLENPNKDRAKVIVSENLYKIFNKAIGKYRIKRP